MENISLYIPTLHNLAGAAGLLIVAAALTCMGSIVGKANHPPEIRLLMGWGIACLVLTIWGEVTARDLRIPISILGIVAVLRGYQIRKRVRGEAFLNIGVMAGVTLPLWLIMLSVRPSQIDTWLNLLPNAAYLYDFNAFPTDAGPESHSFLPGAPYNTQLTAYAVSVVSGGFAEGAMSLFNILLQCAGALFIGRIVAGEKGPSWWSCSAGFLIAVAFNPGYQPHWSFSSYGEGPIAVCMMAAVWYGAGVLDELAQGATWPSSAAPLTLILAAMVNIKQQAIGEFLAVIGTMGLLVCFHPMLPRRRAVIALAIVAGPPTILYGIWRLYVLSNFSVGELKPLPVSEWNWSLLPQIFSGIGQAMFQKATFFLSEIAILIIAIRRLRNVVWSKESLVLGMIAGTIILFDGFLVFTYVAHFPASWAVLAHAFFRYAAQLSMAMMLGLTLALRPMAKKLMIRIGTASYDRIKAGTIALALLLPVAFLGKLRFDLDTPQPTIWRIGTEAAKLIPNGGKLALLLPNDDSDSVGSMMRGVIMYAPPRRLGLSIATDTSSLTRIEGLDKALAAGFEFVLISCTPVGLPDDVPANVAALFDHVGGKWRALQTWTYPTGIRQKHFSGMIARGPVCAAPL